MLAAIPLLLSLAVANVIPVAKKDEGSLIQRDASPFEVYKREGFSIGGDIASEIGAAINSIVHIPGVNNGDILSDVVNFIDKELGSLKLNLSDLDPLQIGSLIEKAIAKVTGKFSGLGGIDGDLIAAIKAAVGSFLGISIGSPSATSATSSSSSPSVTPHVA